MVDPMVKEPYKDFFMFRGGGLFFGVRRGRNWEYGATWTHRNHVRRIVALRWLLKSYLRFHNIIEKMLDARDDVGPSVYASKQNARLHHSDLESAFNDATRIFSLLLDAYIDACKMLYLDVITNRYAPKGVQTPV